MTREVTIAAVQLPAFPEGQTNDAIRENNFRAAEMWLDQAGARGADIACIGETFNVRAQKLTAENTRAALEGVIEETIARLGAVARRHGMYVVAPLLAISDGLVRNIALLINHNGQLIGSYAKVHCIENEKALGVVPGDTWPVFDLDFGRVGIQICHDNAFPESARCLTLNGAEIIFWPHTMSGWGDDFMDVLLRAPSVHNGVWHIPVCFGCATGTAWKPGMLIGRSSIVAPDGVFLADAGRYEGMAVATIDLDAPRIAHDFTRTGDWVWQVDMFNDRRPDTYAPITQPRLRREPLPGHTQKETTP